MASDQTWVSPSHCFHKPLISAEAEPQSGLSNWVGGTSGPRGPFDSGQSLIFQATLPEDPHLTNPALPKDNPTGKGQDIGPQVRWLGLKSLLSTHQQCDLELTAYLLKAWCAPLKTGTIIAHNSQGTFSAYLKLFPATPNSVLLSGMEIIPDAVPMATAVSTTQHQGRWAPPGGAGRWPCPLSCVISCPFFSSQGVTEMLLTPAPKPSRKLLL